VNWEHTLPGGSFVLTARHQLISNTQDNIALVGVGGLYNALGNIGYGRNTEFQASLVTPVPFLWSGLTFQASTTYHFSSVKDSPTRKRRMISQGQAAPWIGKISLTQDLPEWNARLGASYQWPTGTNIWRYNEYRIMHSQALQTDMFVEYKPTPVWLVRLYARNILDTKNLNERYIYAGPRNTSPFVTLEDRRTTFGPQVGFFVQRSFGQ
jgi:outer membrane receptor protein involved in Fe transport